MIKGWTIRRRIIGSFTLVLAMMLVMGVIAYTRLENVKFETVQVQIDTVPGLKYSSDLQAQIFENYALIEAHVLQTDKGTMQRLEEQVDANLNKQKEELKLYETTVNESQDREKFDILTKSRDSYLRSEQEILKLSSDLKSKEAAQTAKHNVLDPEFEKMRAAIQEVVDYNVASSQASISETLAAVYQTKIDILVSAGLILVLAVVCGYFLLRAIDRPLAHLLKIVDVMRSGNFSQRLKLERHDEFGVLADGFNRMIDNLTALIGKVQESGLQVN
ncbi:MAG TPA: methyl-accepting chemotaxis protein, partial [Blastocatellia bacterium]|nr:methyl-accepting chemotaxis protein [Blastocatellia bacterium]